MRTLTALVPALSTLLVLACGGGGGTGGSGGGGASSSSSSSGNTSSGTSSSSSSSSSGTGAAPACTSLADAVRVTTHTVAAAASPKAVTAQRGAGSVVAWAGSDGSVHALPLDASDAVAGAEITTEGTEVFGAAATASDVALLVSRNPDFMSFVRLDNTGAKVASADLVGGGDHATMGVEWFGEFARTGRLVSQGAGQYAAYHALHRRWPDNIGHQGDTLRLLGADGKPLSGGWDWGCSHSMDQRLAAGPNGVVPICIADCYPGKGIYFNHNDAMITEDPGANCAGGYTTQLGGLVAVSDGFFLVYGDASSNGHLGHFDKAGKPISDRALTESPQSRLAAYEDGLLLGSPSGAGTTLVRLDASGQATSETTQVAVPAPEHDFESRSDGEVAWASIQGTTLTVVRVRKCP